MGILEEKKYRFIKYLENKANTLLPIRYYIVGFLITINIAIFAGLHKLYYGSDDNKIYLALSLSIFSIIINLIISKIFFREHNLSALLKEFTEDYYKNEFNGTGKDFYEDYKKQIIERDNQYKGQTFKLIRALLIIIILINLVIGIIIYSKIISNSNILSIISVATISMSILFLIS